MSPEVSGCSERGVGSVPESLLFLSVLLIFLIGVEWVDNVMLISAVQQSDSAIHMHTSIPM